MVIGVLVGQSIVLPATAHPASSSTDPQTTQTHHRRASVPLSPPATELVLSGQRAFVSDADGGVHAFDDLDNLDQPAPAIEGGPLTSLTSLIVVDLEGSGAQVMGMAQDGSLVRLDAVVVLPADILTDADEIVPADIDDDTDDELVVLHGDRTSLTTIDFVAGAPVASLSTPLDRRADAVAAADVQGGATQEIVSVTDEGLTVISFDGGITQSHTPVDLSEPRLLRATARDATGNVDVIVAGSDGLSVLRGTDGTITSTQEIALAGEPADMEIGELTGAPAGDVVVATSEGLFVLSGSDGDYGAPGLLEGATDVLAVEMLEVNGDGLDDVVALDEGGGRLSLLRTNRAPSLEELGDMTAQTEDLLTFTLRGHDADGDALTYDLSEIPPSASFDPTTGEFSWTPDEATSLSLNAAVSDWHHRTGDSFTVQVAKKVHVGSVALTTGEGKVLSRRARLSARVDGAAERVSFQWAPVDTSDWHAIASDNDGSDGWSATWDTTGKTGRYRVRAAAHLGAETSYDHGIFVLDNRAPKVRARATGAFSPNGDGRRDIAHIKIRASEPARFQVSLHRNGRVVRRWTKSGYAERWSFRWTGKFRGRRAPDGSYRLRIRAVDRARLADTTYRRLRIDTKAPRFRWDEVPRRLTTSAGRFTFRYRSRDPSGPVNVRLSLLQQGRRIAYKVVKRSRGPHRWTPPSRYGDGDAFVPGSYAIAAQATDKLGNRRRIHPRGWQYAPPVRAKAYMRLENAGRRVALTFDDCNYGSSWDSILDTLKAHRVKATFFCGGSRVRLFPDLARRVVRDGHDAASHGDDHLLMTSLSYAGTRSQILADRNSWMSITGKAAVPYFRPPYGAYNSTTLAVAGALGFSRVMMWDVDTNDWQGRSASAISSHVLGHARKGSVVLMHVLPSTAASLPSMLKGLKARGLRPVTLSALFRAAGHH